MANERFRFTGRWALAACCALIASLLALASPAWGAYENVPTPTVVGPIEVTPTSHPFLATEIPLASYGYTEQEYFIEGTGYTYNTSGAVNVTGTKITTGGPNGDGTYPFRTQDRRAPTDGSVEVQRKSGRRVEQRDGRLRPRSELVR